MHMYREIINTLKVESINGWQLTEDGHGTHSIMQVFE